MARIHPPLMVIPLILIASATVTPGQTTLNRSPSPEAAKPALSCQVLEVKTADKPGVTLVLFHQSSKADGPRLGDLLRANDGASVLFETSDGHAYRATLFRMATCFGRGLLVFPAGSARLNPHEQFWLFFPKTETLPPYSQ